MLIGPCRGGSGWHDWGSLEDQEAHYGILYAIIAFQGQHAYHCKIENKFERISIYSIRLQAVSASGPVTGLALGARTPVARQAGAHHPV